MQMGQTGDGPSLEQRRRFREGHVDGVSHNPRYQEGGVGEPLVMLPGIVGLQITGAHHSLAERYRVIVFDVPRIREAVAGEYPDLTAGVASHLGKSLRALGIDSFNLLGSSFGANVALWLAIQQPRAVRSLILAAPTARLQRSPSTVMPSASPSSEEQLQAKMASLSVPTLVLFGTDDQVVPPEAGRAYAEQIPNGHYVLVQGAGHALEEDEPGAFVTIVSGFVDDPIAFMASQPSGSNNPG